MSRLAITPEMLRESAGEAVDVTCHDAPFGDPFGCQLGRLDEDERNARDLALRVCRVENVVARYANEIANLVNELEGNRARF